MIANRKPRGKAGDKTICLPIDDGVNYAQLVEDREAYRAYLNAQIAKHPEIFPEGIEQGYRFHGLVESSRQQLKTRRIYLPSCQQAYQIRPDFVMPYMSERVETAGKALYLRQHGLSYDGIAYVLGGSEMHWYNLCQGMGRVSIVGTTVKRVQVCPTNLSADEKHTRHKKQKAYLAVTAAKGCVLGSQLCTGAGYEELEVGYGVFAQEVTHHIPDYQPETVTIDGWDATRQAWQSCFVGIVWILCFLHEVIKVRDLCRSKPSLWHTLREKLWNVYHGQTKREFSQRLRRLREWAKGQNLQASIDGRIKRIKGKSHVFQKAYDFPKAHRTSNAVDRPMNYLDRCLFSMQYFHGSWEAAVQSGRAMALLWNFHPFCRKTRKQTGCLCPFEQLNGFRYHDDWLRNFLIASSLNGRRTLPKLAHTK